MKLPYVLPLVLLVACDVTPVPIEPEPTTNSSVGSTSSATGTGGAGGQGGMGGHGGAGGHGGMGGASSSSGVGGTGGMGGQMSGGPSDGSGSRLRRYVYTSPDGMLDSRSDRFYDVDLATECVPRATPLGLRCVPFTVAVSPGFFSDPACTTPAILARKSCGPIVYYATTSIVQCSSSIGAFAYSLIPSATVAYQKSATCTPVDAATLNDHDVYVVGPEADYAVFAPMSLEHE